MKHEKERVLFNMREIDDELKSLAHSSQTYDWQIDKLSHIQLNKVKTVPYTFVRRGVPVREDTYPEPSACEVGWPVPFLAVFISSVLPPGTHLLLGEQ